MEAGEELAGRRVRVDGTVGHGAGERRQRRTRAKGTDPLAQRGQRDRLDLRGGPRLPAAAQLAAGLQPRPVLVDGGQDVVDALALRGDRAEYRRAPLAGPALAERIRNNATLPAARGRTTIANEVVEKIAGIAAREVPGVFDLGGDVARVFSAVKERLHIGEESAAQGVSVKLDGKTADIEVVIVIEFGFQVFSVTEKVREKVISSVENLLGLDVTNVDVTVDDVHIDEDGPVGNDAERAKGYTAETKAIVVGE